LRGPYSYLLATLAALLTMPHSSAAQSPPAASSAVIYVVRRGWHIDVGFDVTELQPPLKSLATEFPGARYLVFGFGDQHYLLAKDHNAPVLLAALWPGRGMLLVTGLTSPPQEAFGVDHVAALAVTADQTRGAQTFIWQSLDRREMSHDAAESHDAADRNSAAENAADQLKSYRRGPYEGSLYFSATPTYSAFHTCNTWAAETLRAAPLPVHSAGVVFAGQLWRQVRRLERQLSPAAPKALSPEPPRASLPGASQVRAAQLQGGFVPSWQTTVVPEF
jgi:Protein of unknown function (DUF2459)